jgi:hypothetical protein
MQYIRVIVPIINVYLMHDNYAYCLHSTVWLMVYLSGQFRIRRRVDRNMNSEMCIFSEAPRNRSNANGPNALYANVCGLVIYKATFSLSRSSTAVRVLEMLRRIAYGKLEYDTRNRITGSYPTQTSFGEFEQINIVKMLRYPVWKRRCQSMAAVSSP